MAKDVIGKRVRLQIGGTPTKEEDDAVVGEDINVHISSEEAAKYDSIVGEKVELRIGADVDKTVRDMIATITNSDEKDKELIMRICREILAEQNKQTKGQKIRDLISVGAGIASISQFLLQLKTAIGM